MADYPAQFRSNFDVSYAASFVPTSVASFIPTIAFEDLTPTVVAEDLVLPTITLLSPASLVAPILPDAAITFRVADDRLLKRVYLWVEYADSSSEVIYRDGVFLPAFRELSDHTPVGDPSGTIEFTVARGVNLDDRRIGGWPSSPRLYIAGIDAAGNVS
jgi:hypothetical protein